jgi:AraC-like DNA-binding protein
MKPTYTISQSDVGISARHPISAWRLLEKNKTVHPHDHAYHEVALILGGHGWHLTGDQRQKLSRGSLLVSSPGQVHSIEIPEWLDIVNLFYLAEWVFHDFQDYWEHPVICMLFGESLLHRKGLEKEPVKQHKLAAATVHAVQRECEDLVNATQQKEGSHLYLRATFEKILALIGADLERQEKDRKPFRKPARRQKKSKAEFHRAEAWRVMRRLENLIQTGEHFSAEAVVQESPVQAAHLTRVFFQETGKTIMQFYQERRAQVACVRLLNPLQRVTEIGSELGYSDTAHFSRVFHRYYGLSPREFRENHGIKPQHNC